VRKTRQTKRFWAFLGGLSLWGLLAGAASALEARITERTPLCAQAHKNCLGRFFLNPADRVKVLRQSTDGDWYYVEFPLNQQTGWIWAKSAELRKPERLKSEFLYPLSQAGLNLLAGTESSPAVVYPNRLSNVHGETLQHLPGLQPLLRQAAHRQVLQSLQSPEQGLRIYGLSTTEQQLFLLEANPTHPEYPTYRTLLRLEQPQAFKGIAQTTQGLLILAEGQGPWGQSLVTGLGPDGLPYLLMHNAQEILSWVPEEIRSGLNLESLRLLSLNPDGILLASAFHLGLRKNVLLRLRADAQKFWVYDGLLYWPEQIGRSPQAEGLSVRGLGSEADFYVLIQTEQKYFLAYYSGSHQPVAVQALATPVFDALISQDSLWTLQTDGMRRWSPLFSP